jgi:DNA helicase HerA-like ATPase
MPDIRPLPSSWELIDTLKRVWDVRVNYVPIRLAIGRSLLSGDRLSSGDYKEEDRKRAIDTQQIFSGGGTDYTPLFRALIVQRYGRSIGDEEFLPLLKAHVDHGFSLIRLDTEKFRSNDEYVDYLVELAQAGLDQRGIDAPPQVQIVPAFSGLLTLELGVDAKTETPVRVEFNRQTNNYLAVTGKPGSGKTQFVKDLLAQIRIQSDYAVNFIFFDYAKGDVADDDAFIEATRADVVRLPDESLPVNPFARVNVGSETAVKVAAQEFADLIRDVEKRLGTIQAQLLYDAILRGFEAQRGEKPPFPDFDIIRREIEDDYANNKRKLDTLTEIMRQLTDFHIFSTTRSPDLWQSLSDRTVVIDLHGLTVLRELTVCFVLNSLYRELMAMPDTAVNEGVREMRTIVVIDEAHHFLKDKKRNQILERLIREIRSKGASVFLMSQSPDDYDQPDFDFAELLEFIFILQSSANSTKFLQSALGITAAQAKEVATGVANLPTAHAFAKSYDGGAKNKAVRLRVRQFWRDKGIKN